MTKLIAFVAAALLSVTAFAGDNKDKKDHSMKSSAVTFDSLVPYRRSGPRCIPMHAARLF